MYVPPAFAVDDRAWALRLIAEHPFGLLLTCDRDYPRASHIPMVARERDGDIWIHGHLARANAQVDAIFGGHVATAVFQGPHAYVSPRWYEEPRRSVPTWNYVAVQACGRLREADSHATLARLVDAFERGDERWALDEIDEEYYAKQLRGIVAFELRVTELFAKAKLGQNRSAVDQARIAAETGLSPSLGP
ncbi:MAG TPA: FMN-binding negative transcriptional regulator [Candidatus Acidoferrales bacterium]|nr:FMN-binding negative transcriptional regulator [Candidatus Acidoferrales bacterium]